MKIHVGHIGYPGNTDIAFTVSRQRSLEELLSALPPDAKEREWFARPALRDAFPSGLFNCWGVPEGGRRWFSQLEVGDAALIMPTGGTYGVIEYLGIVRAICRTEAWNASKILWPAAPDDKRFPLIFMFDAESGERQFSDFLNDVGWSQNLDLRGNFRSVADHRLKQRGGSEGYLRFLREVGGFHPMFTRQPDGSASSP